MTEIRIPSPGESITEVEIGKWHFSSGEKVCVNDVILDVETDKASLEVCAPVEGILEILVSENEAVKVGTVVAVLHPSDSMKTQSSNQKKSVDDTKNLIDKSGPSVREMADRLGLDTKNKEGSGKDGRFLQKDLLILESKKKQKDEISSSILQESVKHTSSVSVFSESGGKETRLPVSRLRKTLAARLKEVQNTAAILTTFNEVDLSAVMDLRGRYKDLFVKTHDVHLGFMSFFARACIQAMKKFPQINSLWQDDFILYREYIHLGVAVSTEKGLVVPCIKNSQDLSLAGIEKEIQRLANLGREGKLSLDDMSGGTFTITNGGIFGSMLSTPILNAGQTAILGMHSIQKRPVVVEDEIVIRPMMYLALSYDHRVVDGKEAVQFLVAVKQGLEDPSRMLLEI